MPEQGPYLPPDPLPVVEAFMRHPPPREGAYITSVVNWATDTARWILYASIALFTSVMVVAFTSSRTGNPLVATPVVLVVGHMIVIPALWWYRSRKRRIATLMTDGQAIDGEVLRVVTVKKRKKDLHHFRVAFQSPDGKPYRLYFELMGLRAGAEKGDRLAVILEPRAQPRYAAVLTPKHGILATRCYDPPS